MPRLAFLVPGDLATPTGGYVYDRRMAEGLTALGWDLDLYALDGTFPNPTHETVEQARRVLRRIADGGLVLIDGLALGGMPDLAAVEGKRLRMTALIHHPLANETGLSPEDVATLQDAERQALAATAGVVVTSDHTARLVQALGVAADRIHVVRPGTDPAEAARGSPSGTLELLCVATVTPRKGHLVLLDALQGLLDRSWRLICVGSLRRDARTVAEVRRRIDALGLSDRVLLAGELDDLALAERYSTADLFVLPTWFEGYGMALAEAMAHGLPVVSTNAGAIPQTVPAGAGILVPPGDVISLRHALARLMDEPVLRRQLTAGARAAGRTLPTWTQATRCMAAALQRVMVS